MSYKQKRDKTLTRGKKDSPEHLVYLEERGMIIKTKDGYVWTHNPSKKLAKAIREGREM